VHRRALCLYLNTSIIIRALEDSGARRFLEECCSRHRCVVSSVHWWEAWRESSLKHARALLRELSIEAVELDVRRLRLSAMELVEEHGWSPRRTIDLMHVLAAVELDCHGVIAVDRFIAKRAKEYGLLYVNHYTGCP